MNHTDLKSNLDFWPSFVSCSWNIKHDLKIPGTEWFQFQNSSCRTFVRVVDSQSAAFAHRKVNRLVGEDRRLTVSGKRLPHTVHITCNEVYWQKDFGTYSKKTPTVTFFLKWQLGSFDVGLYAVLIPGQCITCSRWPSALICVNKQRIAPTGKQSIVLLNGM